MNKKRDKFVTKGREFKLRNTQIDDLLDVYDLQAREETYTKTHRRTYEKGRYTQKSGLDLREGRIVEMQTNYSYIVNIDGELSSCTLSGRLRYLEFESHNPVCVGDYVMVDMQEKDNYRIEELVQRKNSLTRYIQTANTEREIAIVANIDQIIIVSSTNNPIFHSGLIDRYLTLAEISNINAVICVNKVDIADDLEAIRNECMYYESIGYHVVFTTANPQSDNIGIEELKNLLKNKDSVFTGHSGTGKSSLINAIEADLDLKVGEISTAHHKGQHTTSHSRMIDWSFGGHLIDTPGIKTLALSTQHKDKLPRYFPGFHLFADFCFFQDCSHTHEDNCAILARLGREIPEERYESYLRIMESL
ncbi:MAG: ribosome small subunit-dependent GTPase A [Candidatus Cloacimonadales bacterium]|jgi:ribosome biogenesis GTPase|nr:ribosome small subunit-dependent GTPase A [Candidatus Cloacimonadota bacterium]MDX9977249.1 ribosome small subunit-dependent GTPase A [Candidatus Cloacimonadales bacterium]